MRFFVLLAALVFVPWPCLAFQESGCPAYEEPQILVIPDIRRPAFDVTQNLTQIRAMAQSGDEKKFSSQRHETPVGLTSASLQLKTNYEITSKISPKNRMVCAQISSFSLYLGFPDTTVYLARELPYGSCSYRTVMEHELLHVRTDERITQIYAKQFPEILRKALREMGVAQAGSPEMAEDHFRNQVREYISTLTHNMAQVRKTEQLKIDTREEYERLSRACGGALSQIIAGERQ